MLKFFVKNGVYSSCRMLFVVLVVAVMLRTMWATFVGIVPVSDSLMYREFANSIASGAGYAYPDGQLTVFWAVGASWFYALVKIVFGYSELPIMVVNVLVGAGLVFVSYRIASLYFSAGVALISAWILAVWPVLIEFTTVYASEVLFAGFIAASIAMWASRKGSYWMRSVVWGALLCIATYVRPTALPLFVVLPVLEYIRERNLKQVVTSFVLASCTAAILLAPWVVRNQQVFGAPVLVSANFGVNLWMGNNQHSDGGYMRLPDIQFANEVERDRYFKKEAVEFIRANPMWYLKLALRRAVMTYDRETIGVAWNEPALRKLVGDRGLMVIKAVSTAYWWLVLTLAVCGVAVLLWRKKSNLLHPLVVVSAFFFVVPILTVGQDRYHMPLNPFLAMFAAVALDAAWKRFSAGRSAGRVVNEPQSV